MCINKKVKIKHQNPPPFRKAKHHPPQKKHLTSSPHSLTLSALLPHPFPLPP